MSSATPSYTTGPQQQQQEDYILESTSEEIELIEEEWEFNAPKYFDFDKLSRKAFTHQSKPPHHHHQHEQDEELNHSNADQWFFTPDAQHLEFLDPKYIDINNQADTNQQQIMMMNNYDNIVDISTISKYSVHQESLGSSTNQQQQYNATTNSTLGTINAFNSIRMTPVKKVKRKVLAKLTIPQTPNFKTEKRIRQRNNQSSNQSNNQSQQQSSIMKGGKINLTIVKSSRPSTDLKTLKVQDRDDNITKFKSVTKIANTTTPKPFKFRTDSRVLDTDRSTAMVAGGHSPFNKSILQKINDMRNQIPSRWKQTPDMVTPHKPMKITKPNSFKLRTKFRSRTNTTMMTQNAQLTTTTFKARPLNRKIFESHGELGLSKIMKKDITHPQEFNLMTEERSKKRKFDQSKLEESTNITTQQPQQQSSDFTRPFKARKLDNILSGSYMVQSSKIISKSTTIPESPKLLTKSRAGNRSILLHNHHQHSETNCSNSSQHSNVTFRARPLPTTQPFIPKITHTITVPQPFSLETENRGTIHKKQLDSKLNEKDEKENTLRVFKARPIHHYTNVDTSKILHKPVTVPVSPNITKVKSSFKDSILSSASVASSCVASTIIGPKLPHSFKARPMPDFNNSSTLKSAITTTNNHRNVPMEPFNLATEKRGQVYQSKFKASIQSMERVSISKIDDGTFTSVTKRVYNSIQNLR